MHRPYGVCDWLAGGTLTYTFITSANMSFASLSANGDCARDEVIST